jgi:hypothetical protein
MDINTSSTTTIACNMIVPLCGKIFYGFYQTAIDQSTHDNEQRRHDENQIKPNYQTAYHPSQAKQSLPSASALRSISCITCRSILRATLSALPIFSERQ